MVNDIAVTGLDPSKAAMAKVGDNVVLSLKESLKFENCEEYGEIFTQIIRQNSGSLILDFKSVAVMDSMALELLVETHDSLRRQGRLLKIAAMNAVCKDILMVTRLINQFHVYEDVAEAARSRS